MNNKRQKSCCFSGHREIPGDRVLELQERLKAGIEYVYKTYGVTDFYSGAALGFDLMAAKAVLECRENHPDIRLILAIPCRDQAARWPESAQKQYEEIKRRADDVIYLTEHYTSGCMHRRNRYMVDHSAVCICFLIRQAGGTAYTVDYAKKSGLRVFNIGIRRKA